MTKKHYEMIANALNRVKPDLLQKDFEKVVGSVAIALHENNPAFLPDKFERACYEGKHIRKSIKGA